MEKTEDSPPKKGYWYFITVYYCPLCMREQRYYEKRTDERPRDWSERHEYIDAWDYCDI